jgi:colicin import membrane protein
MDYVKPPVSKPFFLAIFLHLLILSALIFSFVFNTDHPVALQGTAQPIINAEAINANQINPIKKQPTVPQLKPIKNQKEEPPLRPKIKNVEEKNTVAMAHPKAVAHKIHEEKARSAPLQKPVIPKLTVQKTYAQPEKTKEKTPEKNQKLLEKPKAEPKKDTEELTQKLLAEAEEKKKIKLKKEKEAALKKALLAEEMAKEIADDKAETKIKLAAAEAKKEKAKEAKALLAEELKADQQQLNAAQSNVDEGTIDKYKALIKRAIGEHWNIPSNTPHNLTCDLMITLAPGGSVLSVELVKSSGVPALDHSAIQAVYQASPLPIPNDANLFEHFRQLSMTVRPERIVTT